LAERVAYVIEERLEPCEHVALVGALLLNADVSEHASGLVARIRPAHSCGDECVLPLGKMECHLAIDFLADLVGAKDIA
jgi:hypothetical protein